MTRIARECGSVKVNEVLAKTLAEVRGEVSERLGRELGQALETEIDLMLGREAYVRREKVASWVEVEGVCQRCKSRQSRRFSRNGRRRRRLLTCWDEVTLWQQRLVCECGGSVRLELAGWLRPYQRIGEDVDEQIRRWGALRISLREMQEELAHLHISPLALSTLNRRLHQVRETAAADRPLTVPPVLQVDAIWVTQLVPTGDHRLDRKGRRRPVKRRIKRPIFIALGVWPETEHAEVIAWRLADKEDEGDWLAFLSELEALGVRGENGLELVIHDGGSALCAALNTIYFGAAEQRCLFHKLRNISHAIRIDDDQLSAKEKRRRRTAILRDFRHIWEAKQLTTVLQRYRSVVRRYRTTQPAAVRCLRTDFRATIAYFAVLQRHPHWNRRFLRTTSWLERFNRYLRRRVRAAAAYHSDAGLCSMIAHEVRAFKLADAHSRISTT